jgi:hypothetical protein
MRNLIVFVLGFCLLVGNADQVLASPPTDPSGCVPVQRFALVVPAISQCDEPEPTVLRVQMALATFLFDQAERLPEGWLMHHFDLECTNLLFHLGRLIDEENQKMVQPITVSYGLTGQETAAELEDAAKAIIDDLISGRALRIYEEAKSKADSI